MEIVKKDVWVIMSKDLKYIMKGDPQRYSFKLISEKEDMRIPIFFTKSSAIRALKTTSCSLWTGEDYIEGKDLLNVFDVYPSEICLTLKVEK